LLDADALAEISLEFSAGRRLTGEGTQRRGVGDADVAAAVDSRFAGGASRNAITARPIFEGAAFECLELLSFDPRLGDDLVKPDAVSLTVPAKACDEAFLRSHLSLHVDRRRPQQLPRLCGAVRCTDASASASVSYRAGVHFCDPTVRF
jgi:hypothetical protein